MKVSTQWLRDFVTLNPPLENIADRLTLAGLEVKKMEPAAGKEMIFEVEITTNRPDWLSHIGVAREIAAVENLAVKLPPADKTLNRPMPKGWKIDLKEQEGCPYYTGIYIEGVTETATPDFIKERLAACGHRSISLLVDITNYVLLETGQPLHAFDADLIAKQEIQVRKAKPGETFTAIDGSLHKLEASDLVIADAEKTVALAGVMGGKDTEVSARTRNVFLESAYFHPRWVRQTSRRHALASESSYRFERRVDPEGVDFGRDRALQLIIQYAKPRFISGVLRAGRKPTLSVNKIRLSAPEVEKRLGTQIKPHEIVSALTRVGLEVKQDNPGNWTLGIPSFRSDLTQPIDLIEEVARIYGFDKIPENLPVRPLGFAKVSPQLQAEEKIRHFLSGAGFYETVTFSLISQNGLDLESDLKDAVRVNNPLNKDLVWMRPTLAPSLLAVVQKNQSVGAETVALFEIAHVYRMNRAAKQPEEEKVVSLIWTGKKNSKAWLEKERIEFYDLQGAVLELLAAAGGETPEFFEISKSFLAPAPAQAVVCGGETVGFLGLVSPRTAKLWDIESKVYYAEISIPKILKHMKKSAGFKDLPKYPAIVRDLAVIVPDDVKSGPIENEIRSLGQGLIREVELFDLFQGGRIPKGHKNLAYRVVYQSAERTLVSDEIQKLHFSIADAIVKKFQATFQQS